MDHELSVASDASFDPLANCPKPTIREHMLGHLNKMASDEFGYNYGAHNELPIRPDSHTFMYDDVFHESHDPYWEGFVLEAVGMTPGGVPSFQLIWPPTKRRLLFQAPCFGILFWVKQLPPERIKRPWPREAPDEELPKVTGWTSLDDLASDGWLEIQDIINWAKVQILIAG